MISPAADHFLTEWGKSIRRMETAEGRFREVQDAYSERFGAGVTAEYRAASDADLRTAVSDCAYYRDRATMYGLSALVQLTLDASSSPLILSRLAALHRPDGEGRTCLECGLPWECSSRQVLDGKVPFALDVAGWSA